jgi:deoxyribose-phosphate aldolase
MELGTIMNMNSKVTAEQISKMIDHSLLHPTMTDAQIREGCELSKKYHVATACVKPYSVPLAADILAGSDVLVCSVICFPHGNGQISSQVAETALAIREGASEIDMVANAGKILGGDWDFVTAQIRAMNETAVSGGAILKVIFENDYLQPEHIVRLCEICSALEVAFIKTSTGYGFVKQANGDYNYRGATENHLKLMRHHAADKVQIKAAGGVRTLDDTLAVRSWGVTRIGATATQAIIEEARKREAAGTLLMPGPTGSLAAGSGGY